MLCKRFSLCLLSVFGSGVMMLGAASAANKPDRAKHDIEVPAKQAVAARTAPAPADNPRVAAEDNPRVVPAR